MGPITTWAAASSLGLVVMTGLYLDKRDDYAAQVETCNASKLAAVAEAEKVTRESLEAATARRISDMARQADAAERARQVAEDARIEAESRPERVRTIVREVASANACIDTRMPSELINSLRD